LPRGAEAPRIPCVGPKPEYRYLVERKVWGAARAEVSLVRRQVKRGLLARLRGHEDGDDVVVFRRTFRPRVELAELDRYIAELELAARYANEGTFGCFVDTRSRDGVVEIALYERWFNGRKLCCDELAHREFDAEDEQALVASAEFVTELQEWAERRNDERETAYRSESLEDDARRERATERASAGEELTQILDSER
jgi:hypothetical protein